MINIVSDLKNAVIYKSNSLIEASYRLSVVEQRIVLACLSQVRHDEPVTDEVMYSVTAQDIADLTETDVKTTYRDLQEGALRLKRREVRIEKEANSKKKRKQVLVCNWVQTVMYIESEGRVCLRFNKDMLPYLTELSAQFTKYRLKAVAKMDSSYAIRLYEWLIQWRDTGQREVEVSWLREALQLGGKYAAIKDLKKWVVDLAVTQINQHSDLTVSYTQKKAGRTISHFVFSFQPKRPPRIVQAKQPPKTPEKSKMSADETFFTEFVNGDPIYQRRYGNLPPAVAYRTPAVKGEFDLRYQEWLKDKIS